MKKRLAIKAILLNIKKNRWWLTHAISNYGIGVQILRTNKYLALIFRTKQLFLPIINQNCVDGDANSRVTQCNTHTS